MVGCEEKKRIARKEKHIRNSIKCERLVNLGQRREKEEKDQEEEQ